MAGILARAILRAASYLTPRTVQAEWLREWTAELWYVREGEAGFCLGAFRDAWTLRRQAGWRGAVGISSPVACLAVLAAAAGIGALIVAAFPAVQAVMWKRPVTMHLLIAGGSLLFYLVAPGARRVEVRGARGWWFLAAKMALLLLLVFFGSFVAMALISRVPAGPNLVFVMYVGAYRWAIWDQLRRCPACLRVLTNPVAIGHPAGTLLGWYGAESMCPKGHGVLHEPELPASTYCARQWIRMDASWAALFR